MDKIYVKSTIDGLKSSSSSRVQETLLKIRSKIIINDNGIKLFRECGGFDYLLPHLRKPNERILDITLSILGNCCLEEESSLLVGKLNCYGSIVSILQTVCRDSIVGRACRVIGNLAQKNVNAETLHNHGAVTALVSLIEGRDKNTSYPTLTMSVRAIRHLWMVADKREEMLSLNVVRCVAILLTTECESAGIIKTTNPNKEYEGLRKSQEELITGILKCLGYFTTYSTSACAEQIQGDGRGYQCLVALTKTYESLALKCLMNLCYLSPCRPLLGTAGLVECLVGLLQKIPDAQWWPEGCARALAQLSAESVNRSRLRHCGGLPLLVAAARVSSHAMNALLQYVFDDTSFQILVNEGLVTLLTNELTQHLATMEVEHNNMENADMLSETSHKPKEKQKLDTQPETQTKSLFSRRRSVSKNEDELKVVIERDNMIVGFVDAVDSDATDDSQSNDECSPLRRKCLKRMRARSPKSLKKKSPHLIRMASKAWSAGVYWEPKSPEWGQPRPSSAPSPASPRADRSPLSPADRGGFSPEYRGYGGGKRPRWEWSPESGISTGEGSSCSPGYGECQDPWSPASEGPASPYSARDESSDSEISGRYSPVCSEPDAEGEGGGAGAVPTEGGEDAAQVAQDLDELIVDDGDSVDGEPSGDESTKAGLITQGRSSRIACVLVLLFRVSYGACGGTPGTGVGAEARGEGGAPAPHYTMDVLAGNECLFGLLDYMERCRRPRGRVARIISKVLSNALCLMSFLKHRLALRLHNMAVNSRHPPAKCQQCRQIVRLSTQYLSQLSTLAESSYGVGEISYQLLKGTPATQQTLSLTLPYIVRTIKPLKKYFIDCNALNLLISIIADSREELHHCVTALVKLAANVHIKDPKTLETRFKDEINVSYDPILDNLTADEIVTFELDDRSTVKANKVFLCQNSEVFSAMLMGCFKESAEKYVKLKKVTKPALEYLLTLLHCGLNSPKSDVQIFPMADKLETNLEVLLLADRFLFDKLKELLSSAILQFQLTPETAHKIYVWSLCEGMGFLCVESVAYLLTGKMTESDRTRSFRAILELEYKEQWLDDIKSMILRQLVNNVRG